MPSRAYTSFLLKRGYVEIVTRNWCQCPLGLIPHFYVREAISSSCGFDRGVNALSGLYLISTFAEAVYVYWFKPMSVNALSGLYLISTQTAHS